MIQKHPRYKKITTYNGNEVSFIIFHKEYKLRSHTVKHFLHSFEWERGWIKIYSNASLQDKYNLNEIKELRTKVCDCLKEMNCPYIIASETEENDSCRMCSFFSSKCYNTGIEKLQSLYVELIRYSIEKALQIPRYSKFTDFYLKQNRLNGVIEGSVIIRAHLLLDADTESVYNVMTSFVPLNFWEKRKFTDILSNEKIKISSESRRYLIEWHKEATWEPALYLEEKERKIKKYDKFSKKTPKEWINEFYNFYDYEF